jgi:hypothetical protein
MLTQKQIDKLEKLIYDSIMGNPEYGLGEMGEAREEAARIVEEWLDITDIKIKKVN